MERGAGGAKLEARSFSRPAGVILSVDHESSSTTCTFGSAPRSRTFAAIASRISSSATAEEGRRELDPHAAVLDGDVADDAEVEERDDGDLRIRDRAERVPDLRFGHHVAPGTLRRTIVISSHNPRSSSE